MNTTNNVPSFHQVHLQETWVGGPTHQLQKQDVAGYTGHVHHLVAENQYGKSFARITAECRQERIKDTLENKELFYQSSYKSEFNEPNRRQLESKTQAEKTYEKCLQDEQNINYQQQQWYQAQPKSLDDIPPIDRIPVVGYQGFRPVFKHPLKVVVPPSKPNQYVHPLSQIPALEAIEILNDPQQVKKFTDKQPPVVGYTGFLTGIRAENKYGNTFKNIATEIVNQK